jgi:hypothetical protein
MDELKKLHWEGVSHTQIAKLLNEKFGTSFTKSAVTGRIHRTGLYQTRSAAKPELARKSRVLNGGAAVAEGHGIGGRAALELARKRSAEALAQEAQRGAETRIGVLETRRSEVRGGFLALAPKTAREAEAVPASHALPGTVPRPWTEREFGECSWPVDGHGEVQLSCCARVVVGRSWCERHMEIGHRPAPKRVLTPEHLEKLRLGRIRAGNNAQRTRAA